MINQSSKSYFTAEAQSTQSPTPYTIYFVVFTKTKYGWGWERHGYPRKSVTNKRGIK